MLLAIDTATRTLSLAVHDGEALLAEQTLPTPNRHTEQLAPAIEHMLHQMEISFDDLTALAVVVGPGSYTGVRIGVAMAKGLAAARGLPLVGLTTLDVLVAGQPQYNGTLIAVVSAGRGRVIAGRYRWNYTHWAPRGEHRLLKWEELFETIDSRVTIAGEINKTGRDTYKNALSKNPELNVTFAPPAFSLRRAGFLAELAWAKLREGSPDDYNPVLLAPVYMNTIE